MKKSLVMGLVALFIGVAFVPCINANTSKTSVKNELFEITIEICGSDGNEEKIAQLTKQDAIELEIIFDDMKIKLDNVNTKQETIEIFNDVIVSLDELGLLPKDMSVKEVQQLVTNINFNENILGDDNENFNCLIAGNTKHTLFFKPWWPVYFTRLILIKPLVNGIIAFGEEECVDNEHVFDPASGWVWTRGSNGVKTWDSNSLWGNLGPHYEIWYLQPNLWIEYWYYNGATGFTGISIKGFSNARFFGTALHVAIVTKFSGKSSSIDIPNSHISQHSSLLLRFLECFPMLERLLTILLL